MTKFIRGLSYNTRLAIVAVSAFLFVIPIIFIISNSFMSVAEAGARYTSQVTLHNAWGLTNQGIHMMEATFLPDVVTFSAYEYVLLNSPGHLRVLWNSIILVVPIVLGQLVIGPLAAYGFERSRHKHKEKLFFLYIITMLMPLQALLVPHFIVARFFGFDGNYLAIILPAIFGPFGVFLIRQYMKSFEKSMLEAASMDGASEMQIFLKIVLPNIKPALTALLVLAFADAWNIVDQVVVFIQDTHLLPMSVYLSNHFIGNIGIVFALSTIFMLPALIVFLYGQDSLGDGIKYSGIR